ncbi:MAG: penicillin-binding protein 2, partial [Chloroflexota bacterium]|nr:penicillin-binding protein 2 [Chloroflexota bacterium]
QRAHAARPNRISTRRVVWVLLFFVAFGAYNTYRVFSVQVLQHEFLSVKAENLIAWSDEIPPRRGLIYDSRGQLLAGNVTARDVDVDISRHKDDESKKAVADKLAPILGQDPKALYTKLKEAPEGTVSVRVATKVDDATVEKIRKLIEEEEDLFAFTISMRKVPLRQYPGGTLAASLLGYTDYANIGHYGVEEYYNKDLAGEAGWIFAEHDNQGRPLVLEQPQMQLAKDGSDLVLTIDSAVQYIVERGLKQALDEYKAESGYVIVQDPNTGAILAMANYPSYDPNAFNKENNYEKFKNVSVSNIVEAGSTMKVLTYASAIDAGAVLSTTTVNIEACWYKYGWPLCNAENKSWGIQTMTVGLGRSANVASMFAAEHLGEKRFYDYMQAFRLGRPTGVDIAGEVGGTLWLPGEPEYSPVNLYTNSFGQGVSVTPIQLINAVSAVANGGTLYKPYVMQEVRQGEQVIDRNEPQILRAGVIKPDTGQQIANMMAWGVENKLVARLARVPGYHVSVKTGTAQIPGCGGYCDDQTLASAIGFAPSQQPKFTLYIALYNPRTSPWGENTASPAWGKIAKELLLYMKVQPTEPVETPTPQP